MSGICCQLNFMLARIPTSQNIETKRRMQNEWTTLTTKTEKQCITYICRSRIFSSSLLVVLVEVKVVSIAFRCDGFVLPFQVSVQALPFLSFVKLALFVLKITRFHLPLNSLKCCFILRRLLVKTIITVRFVLLTYQICIFEYKPAG